MEVVPTGLPDIAPLSWAVRSGSTVYTALVPIRPDGSFETGDMEAQATLTFENLKRALAGAGGSLRDVVQVVIYLTDISEAAAMTAVWKRYFSAPWPNRAVIGTSALTVPGMRIEILATAVVES